MSAGNAPPDDYPDDACVWESEENSDRGWFVAIDHPGEDSEPPEMQHLWSFCPYCGKPITFETEGK